MRWFWVAVKVLAGVALTLCGLGLAIALVLASLTDRVMPFAIGFAVALVAYFVANRKLSAIAVDASPPPLQWRGERLALRPRWGTHAAICVAFAGVVLLLAYAVITHRPRGTGAHWLTGLGLLFFAWLTLVACLGLVRRREAGFALLLDASGVRYPGMPLVPWSSVRGVSINPASADSDTGQSLVLQVHPMPARQSALSYWLLSSLPGVQYGRGKVSLPLALMHMDSDEVLAAAQELWRRSPRPTARSSRAPTSDPARNRT